MATRSRIAIETLDHRGEAIVKSIYCHNDGYPSDNGKILADNYQAREKVEALIALGDISSLDKEVHPSGEHSFDNRQPGVTTAYHRDRGEEIIKPKVHASRAAFVKSDVEEYGYLFTLEGEWLFIDGHKNASTREAIPLASVI